MKILLLTWLGFCVATALPAQGPADSPPTTKRTAAELGELLGPIALYPDALIALILPAATSPSDIVLAARYVAADGNPARVEEKSWDSSVKALTRYPDTLRWMDENLEWTTQVGDAFIEQPVEVMEAIQRLRAKARALGNLVDTPEQRVILDDADIRIIPAQPNYIFEPRYDPQVIYVERPSVSPLLIFGLGFGIGSWLNYDFDWRRHRLYRGEWNEGWDYHRDKDRREHDDDRYINNNLTNSRVWQPDPSRHRAQHQINERTSNIGSSPPRTQSRDSGIGEPKGHHAGIARPKPFASAHHSGETIRRAEPVDDGKPGKGTPSRTLHNGKPGDDYKGQVAAPKSAAPGMTGDHKRGSDTKDHDGPSKKEAAPKDKVSVKKESSKPEAPKRAEPKHEAPTHKEEAKHDAPKRAEPKHEAPKQQDKPSNKKGKDKGDDEKKKGKGKKD